MSKESNFFEDITWIFGIFCTIVAFITIGAIFIPPCITCVVFFSLLVFVPGGQIIAAVWAIVVLIGMGWVVSLK